MLVINIRAYQIGWKQLNSRISLATTAAFMFPIYSDHGWFYICSQNVTNKNYVENKKAFVLFITRDEQVDLGDAQS